MMMSKKYIDNISERCVKRREINKENNWLKTCSCISVANYIIDQVGERCSRGEKYPPLSVTRLQKLIFFSDVLYMIEHHGKSIFEPETKFDCIDDEYYLFPKGPAILSIFNCFSISEAGNVRKWRSDGYYVDDNDAGICDAIDKILRDTANIPTCELVEMARGPWFKERRKDELGRRISKEEIYEYYQKHGVPYGI